MHVARCGVGLFDVKHAGLIQVSYNVDNDKRVTELVAEHRCLHSCLTKWRRDSRNRAQRRQKEQACSTSMASSSQLHGCTATSVVNRLQRDSPTLFRYPEAA